MPSGNTEVFCVAQQPATGTVAPPCRASMAARLILVLLLLYTAYFASAVLIPITLAILMSLVLSPAVDRLVRWRLPRPLAAACVVLSLLFVSGSLLVALTGPAAEWAAKAPASFKDIERKLQPLKEPIKQLQKAEDRLNELTEIDKKPVAAKPENPKRVDLTQLLLKGTPSTLVGFGATVILLFFLLSRRDAVLRKFAAIIPRLSDKKRAVDAAREIQQQLSAYFSTIALINLILGATTAGLLWAIGFPNPILWGTMAGVLNFVPYLGALVSATVIAVVSLLTYDALSAVLLPPLSFLALTIVEGQLVTPLVVGRRLALSPVVVFMFFLVLGWMWGIAGALIAIPLLAGLKIVCTAIEPLQPVARFVSD